MLTDLYVRNLAVLEEATVELGDGLNVLTGETGAGKSIVVDALALLAGARASADLIRTGADELSVTGRFERADRPWREALEEAGLEGAGDELVVRREVARTGRNRVYVNDQPVTLRLMSIATAGLLRVHAQREELELATAEQQRLLVDALGGDEGDSLLLETAVAYEIHAGLRARLTRLRGDAAERQSRVEFLRYQLEELDRLGLRSGEERELAVERDGLRNAEAITLALGGSVQALLEDEGSAVERLGRVQKRLEGLVDWVPEAGEWSGEAAELGARCDELATALRRRLDGAAAHPARLDAVEGRLAELERVLAKHGGDSAEVLERAADWRLELEELTGDEDATAGLEADARQALDDFAVKAATLSEARRKWAERMERDVAAELADLALGGAVLTVSRTTRPRAGSELFVADREVEFGPWGYDRVELSLAANPGEEAKPLARSASGGELSRVYLALQLVCRGSSDSRPTMVFDEADSGLGGEAAAALGRKLRALGESGQVLAVTHLAQVAGCAHRQFHVAKSVSGGRTRTGVEPLEKDARVREIARMLAGDQLTPASLEHAEELLRASA